VAQTLPTAAALQQSGLLDLNRDGLKLRIAECFAPSGDSKFANRHYYPPPPFPLDDYIMLIQMRDMRKGGLRGVVCFSSSGVVTQDVLTESDGGAQHLEHGVGIYGGLHGFQRFNNQVELAEDAESDSYWTDYCADKANDLREQPGEISEAQRLDDDSMLLYVVLVRRSDGAVHQLVSAGTRDDMEDHSGDRFVCFDLDASAWDPECPCVIPDFHSVFEMRADDRRGASWNHIRVKMRFYHAPGNQCWETTDRLAHSLAMLSPWI